LVLLALASHAGEKRRCFVSQTTLAAEVDISESSVKRALKWLADSDYIKVIPRWTDNGKQRSSVYRMTFPTYGDVYIGDDDADPDDMDPDDFYAGMDETAEGGHTEPPSDPEGVPTEPVTPSNGFSQTPLGGSQGPTEGVHSDLLKKNPVKNNPVKKGGGGFAVNAPTREDAQPETPPPSRVDYPEHLVRGGYWPTGDVYENTIGSRQYANVTTSINNYREFLKDHPNTDRRWQDRRWIRWFGEDEQKAELAYMAQLDANKAKQYSSATGQAKQAKPQWYDVG
jgi:hypothetical protein